LLVTLVSFANPWHRLAFTATRGRLMPDEILTLPEIAVLLKVAAKTVYT
jgi:hypothetical protein